MALDGYVNQENKDLSRGTFLFIRSFLVSSHEKERIFEFLRKQNLGGRWLPEKPEFRDTFFSEVPWSSAFPDHDSCDLSFVIGENKVTVKRPKMEIIIEGDNIKLGRHDKLEEFEEIQREYKKFQATMPVCDLMQDVTDGEVGSISTLTKNMCSELNLIGKPQSFDLHTRSGGKVTRTILYNNSTNNKNHLFYIKKEMLDEYLENNGLSLIWAIWGERNYSFSSIHHAHENLPDPSYAVFSDIWEYGG